MGISRYLAMTAAEMEAFSALEGWTAAYMACHFSPYSTGLSNIPASLPPNAMLILNDRTPICGHDPERIEQQLSNSVKELACDSVLLDFQRPDKDETSALCRHLVQTLPCPVGIAEPYAAELDCPVFLSPTPLDLSLEEYIRPWHGREIWLDIAPDAACIAVTETGSSAARLPFFSPPDNAFTEETLHCCYRTEVTENEVRFHLWRDLPQIKALVNHAEALEITKCIGLYQQLCTGK